MRYDEIPKFKNFSIDTNLAYGFVGYINFINDAVQNQGLQMQSWFQRQHVWTEDQQIAYIEFFLKGGISGRDVFFNLNLSTGEFVCVDGLQRTNAIERFVDNEICAFGQHCSDFRFPIRDVAGIPSADFKVNVHMNHIETHKEILEWYYSLNSGGTPHSKEELDKIRQLIAETTD